MRSAVARVRSGSEGRLYGLLMAVALFAVVFEAVPLDGRFRAVVALLPPLVVAVIARAAARSAVESQQRALWWVVCGAHVLVACALTLVAARDVALAESAPSGMQISADILMLLYYPVLAAGLLLLRTGAREGLAATIGTLDTIIFTMSAAVLSWQFILAPNLADSESLVGAAAAIAYPLSDVLLAFAIVYMLAHEPPSRYSPALWLLVGGLALRIGLDTANVLQAASAQAALGRTDGVLWALTYLPVAAAAAVALAPTRAPSGQVGAAVSGHAANSGARLLGGVRLLLPYLAFPAVAVLLYARLQPDGSQPQLLLALGFAAALVALVMLRQFVSLLETRRLSRTLLGLSADLERQVDERTTELETRAKNMSLLNYVVTELGYCLTMDEVASRALELAAKSMGSERGVVWTSGDDGIVQVKTAHGLGKRAAAAIEPLLAELLAEEGLAAGEPRWLDRSVLLPVVPSAAGSLAEEGGVLLIPVPFRGAPIGAIGLLFDEDLPFSELDRELASAIGGNLGVALENARSYDEARRLADRDSVTGLLNHRAIHERLEHELSRAQRGGHRVSLVMMDLDEFKLFNDTYGHPVGDKVLRDVSAHLQNVLRASPRGPSRH